MIALYFKNSKNIKNNSEFIKNNLLIESFDLGLIKNYKNVDAILQINDQEKIIELNYDTNKSNNIVLISKGWEFQTERIISNNNNKNNDKQNICILSEIDPPFLSDDLFYLKNYFIEKNYLKFVEESELLLQNKNCSIEDYLMICFYLANVYYYKLKEFYKSRDLLLRAVSIKEDFHEAWCAWADILLDTGQYKKALDSYEKTIEKFNSRKYKEDRMPTNKSRGYEYPLEKINLIKNYKKDQTILEKLT